MGLGTSRTRFVSILTLLLCSAAKLKAVSSSQWEIPIFWLC
ncbi:hypothetical protein FOXYSP1_07737 [Fusarium oxysporum f. sp. phaseoli]